MCPHCQGRALLNLTRTSLRCTTNICRKELSIRHGTFFATSKLQCKTILTIGYLWLQKTPVKAICDMTKVTKATICAYQKHYRQLIASHVEEVDAVIGGPGVVVEIDESKLGKRKYNRGHHVDGAWVIGGVEKTQDRKMFLCKINKRDRNTLIPIILRHVMSGSIIRTDLWKAYGSLSAHNYTHETVNHSKHFKDPNTGVHTNTIEGTWNGIKMQIKPRNRTKEGIQEHLMEFIWRRKNKDNLWAAFLCALRDIHYCN